VYSLRLANWTTLRAAASETSIVQPSSQWLDTRHYEDFVGWLEVKEFSTGSLTFAYQFSPTMDDSLFASSGSVAISATGVSITKLLRAASAVYGARYLRYQISCGGGVAWDLTFRCWVSASRRARRRPHSERARVAELVAACPDEEEHDDPHRRHDTFVPAGDLKGSQRWQTVAKLMGVPLDASMSSPTAGQIIELVDSTWRPVTQVANTYYGTYAARPSPTAVPTGTRYVVSDGPVEFVSTGSAWVPLVSCLGVGNEVAPNNTSPFTLVTSTSVGATIATSGGCLHFSCTGNNGSAQGLQYAEMGRTGNLGPVAYLRVMTRPIFTGGVYVRDSSGGRALCWELDHLNQFSISQYASATSFSSSPFASPANTFAATPVGIRLRCDGTNYYAETTLDGQHWFTHYTQAKTAWVPSGGDKCGLMFNPYSAAGAMSCLSWAVQ